MPGLVEMLAEYQALAAAAAWSATAATPSAPWPPTRGALRPEAEALYDEMAAAHRAYLPERLVA